MSPLVVVAFLKSKPGKAGALRDLLASLIVPTLAEPGCIRYEMNEGSDGTSWIFTEQWSSEELWNEHMETPHLMRLKAAQDDLVSQFDLFTGAMVPPPA